MAAPDFADLERRLAALEARTIKLGDLPLANLQRKLENDWQPDANVLLQPRSVSLAALAAPYTFGAFDAAGAILNPGSGDWTSVRTAVGAYTVTFIPGFHSNPVVVATIGTTGGGLLVKLAPAEPTFTSAVFVTYEYNTGANTDARVHFVAVGT